MKKMFLLFTLLVSISHYAQPAMANAGTPTPIAKASVSKDINKMLDSWNLAAANAKFDDYFSYLASDAVFIGTDPTERWNVKEFRTFAKPYFEKGKAWNFTSLERHIYTNDEQTLAWFDELLDTQMKICRGSGMLRLEKGKWKIVQYVLSMTVPNDDSEQVVKLKAPFDDKWIKKIKEAKEVKE